MKLTAIVVVAAMSALTIRRTNGDFALLVGLCGCCVAAAFVVELAQPVVSFALDLAQTASIQDSLLSPLLKTVGVGLLTQISSALCTDAGESALAKLAELGGSVLCVCVSLPLMAGVLELIQKMTGG